MRIAVFVPVVALTLLSANVPARGVLIDSTAGLTNPSFEAPTLTLYTDGGQDRCNYQNSPATGWSGGWLIDPADNRDAIYQYRPGTNGLKSNGGYFYDPTDGVNGGAIVLRLAEELDTGWQYQSLGTVTVEDVGKLFQARIDTSVRYAGTSTYDGERRISFRSGVTSGKNGSFGALESMDLSSATRSTLPDDPFHTITEFFQPDGNDLGKEIFLVFSVYDEAVPTGQYQFDNVQLTLVPEPGTACLLVVGLLGLLGWVRRRHG